MTAYEYDLLNTLKAIIIEDEAYVAQYHELHGCSATSYVVDELGYVREARTLITNNVSITYQ